jgi:hypothetical protein
MLQQFVDSGFYNSTFWFVFVIGVAVALGWRLREHRFLFGLAACFLVIGTAGNLFLSLYRAYTIPGDIVQDVVSAQEFLAGRPLYPDDMTARINVAMAAEGPRRSLFEPGHDKWQREQKKLLDMLTEHWVQAHPPFMTVYTAPFAGAFGILGTQIAFTLIALTALALTLRLIQLELFPQATGWTALLVAIAALGWDAVEGVLRRGQSGLLLCFLLTASWFLLRRGRPGFAGIAAGFAISLKLVPGLILLVLILRHRQAFLAAVATVLFIGLAVLGLTSVQDHLDYLRTSQVVMAEFGAHPGNVSLFGALMRGVGDLNLSLPIAKAIWLLCGAVIAAALAWRISRAATNCEKTDLDLQFGVAMTLMPLLSPVSWEHYLTYLILPLAVLASRVVARGDRRALVKYLGLLLFFCVPDATFYWLTTVLERAGLDKQASWLVEDLRLIGLAILAVWLAREMSKTQSGATPVFDPPARPNG